MMKTVYQQILIRLGALAVLLFLLDWGVGTLLHVFYFKQHSGLQYRTTYALEQTRADVLFFGSSRCNHHYNPLIFEDGLKLTSYNAGRDGNGLPYHYAVLKSILQRHTPKVVVLDLLAGDFANDNQPYERLSSLLPYYATHPEIRPVVQMKSPFESAKLLSHIYPFNSSLLTIAAGNMQRADRRTEDIKGYLPLTATWQQPLKGLPGLDKLQQVDARKVKLFESFITDCQQKNVRLYVAISPYYLSFDNQKDTTLVLARQLAAQYNVPLWDYSQDEHYLRSPHYFADPTHLNVTGATHYSQTMVGLIRGSLLSQNKSKKDAWKLKPLEKMNRQVKTASPRLVSRSNSV